MKKELLEIAACHRRRPGENFALASLVTTQGSSYRKAGARMLISTQGVEAGSLSGGCLEEEIAYRAQEVIRNGQPIRIPYDTQKRFGCNGTIEVLIERVGDAFLEELSLLIGQRRSFYLAVPATGTGHTLILRSSGEAGEEEILQFVEARMRLVVLGNGPESAALLGMAEILGWEYEEAENVSGLTGVLDSRTAVLVKTHNYGRDFAALQTLLPLGLAYVGLIGSQNRRDRLLHDLIDHGLTTWDRLHAPAGLDLGAEAPEEIALSVIAEIQQVIAGGSGEILRSRKEPVHARNTSPLAAAA